MMYSLVSDRETLLEYQKIFQVKMYKSLNKSIFTKLSLSLEPMDKTRYWNGFWIKDELICEINIPFEGINTRIGAAFVKNENGEVILVHRGTKLHNTKKEYFFKHYRGEYLTLILGKKQYTFALIGKLMANDFPKQVEKFVLEVKRIKNLAAV